jgi:transposase
MDKTRCWSGKFIHRLRCLPSDQEWDHYYLHRQLNDLEIQRKITLEILRQMRSVIKKNTVIKRLKSVCGLGIINAFTLYAEIFDIKRFRSLDKLACYIGLIPAISSSGESEIIKGLTFRHSRYLRHILIEAAWVGIRKDPALTLKYDELIKRMSAQKAIIRIAKKILNRIRYVWLNEKEYNYSVVA